MLLPAAQQHFLAAKRALSIAYGCGLVRSANGVHPSCQSSVLLLAGSACGLEQLYLLGEKHGVFTDNDKTAGKCIG